MLLEAWDDCPKDPEHKGSNGCGWKGRGGLLAELLQVPRGLRHGAWHFKELLFAQNHVSMQHAHADRSGVAPWPSCCRLTLAPWLQNCRARCP